MKKLFIVANWKSHKSIEEGHSFLVSFFHKGMSEWLHGNNHHSQKIVIFCPPFTILSTLKTALLELDHKNLQVFLGAQDISPFAPGSHTGEESAEQLAGLVEYVIIGHSERRNDFHETDHMLAEKVLLAKNAGIQPIFCVQGAGNEVPPGVEIVAFEPVKNIGTGVTDSLEEIETVAAFYKQKMDIRYVLYGGSVTFETVGGITSLPSIDGVLVGGASLDPQAFSQIVIHSESSI